MRFLTSFGIGGHRERWGATRWTSLTTCLPPLQCNIQVSVRSVASGVMRMTASLIDAGMELRPSQLRDYHDRGYTVVRGVFAPAEMALVSLEADRLLARADLINTANLRCRWQPHCESDECLFETFDPVIDLGPLESRAAQGIRCLLGLLRSIYGEEGFLFKDDVYFQTAPRQGLRPPPGLHCLAKLPALVRHRRRRHRSLWAGEWLHDRLSRLPPPRRALAGGWRLSFAACRDRGRKQGGVPARTSARRRRSVRLLHAPPFRPERFRPLPAALPELQHRQRRRRSCREEHYREFLSWLRKKYAEYGKTNVYFA